MSRKKKSSFKIWPLVTLTLLCAILILVFFQRHEAKPITALSSPPHPFISHGLDVSHHQGEINWPEVIESLDSIMPFVYCKATEGETHIDTRFKENRRALKELNVRNGAYHFFQPDVDALNQAIHFLAQYDFEQSDLPPVLDYEIESDDKEGQLIKILAWLKHVENVTGKKPLIYTSYNLYINWLSKSLPDYNFWVANYSDKAYRFQQDNIVHWQYSEKGVIGGIDGYVDLNYSKIKF